MFTLNINLSPSDIANPEIATAIIGLSRHVKVDERWLEHLKSVAVPSRQSFESKGEMAARAAIEKIYSDSFPRDRPSWLINPENGARMELDGVNHDLKIAFMYHGKHHYEFVPLFHKTRQDFVHQVMMDSVRLDICDSMGYYVITIPYHVPIDEIESYIIKSMPV